MDQPSANNAIQILSRLLSASEPDHLAFWVTPNVILTLAGARAYCDGVFYGNAEQRKIWQNEISLGIKTLSSLVDLDWSRIEITSSKTGEKYTGYELITRSGLDYVLMNTDLLNPIGQPATGEAIFKQLVEAIKPSLSLDETEKEHAAFGILVGYPDKAILGAINSWRSDNRLGDSLIPANIRGADYYWCPQPVYDYPRELLGDTMISGHERLWSSILEDYYTSDFHKKLAADADFNKKIHELGLAED